MTTYWKPCDQHTLEPIPGWVGRYKCKDCGVVLYRRVVLIDPQLTYGHGDRGKWKRPDQYVAYKCPKCNGQTTGKKRVCPACRAKEQEEQQAHD